MKILLFIVLSLCIAPICLSAPFIQLINRATLSSTVFTVQWLNSKTDLLVNFKVDLPKDTPVLVYLPTIDPATNPDPKPANFKIFWNGDPNWGVITNIKSVTAGKLYAIQGNASSITVS